MTEYIVKGQIAHNYTLLCQTRAADCHSNSVETTNPSVRVYWQNMAADYYRAARFSLHGVACE